MLPPQPPRQLPQDLDAEKNIIYCLMHFDNAVELVIHSRLKAKHFFVEAHATLFRMILELRSNQQPVDYNTLLSALTTAEFLEEIGGGSDLATIAERSCLAKNLPAYISIVKNKAVERAIIKICLQQAEEAYLGVADHLKFRKETKRKIIRAISDREVKASLPIGKVLEHFLLRDEISSNQDSGCTGLPTGFREIDKKTSGWLPGELIVVASAPGIGKSSFLLNTSLHAALNAGASVAFFSMEMNQDELALRLLAMAAGVELGHLKNAPALTKREWKLLRYGAVRVANAQLFLDDTANLTILELKTRAQKIKEKYGLGMVVVDYLQLMRGQGKSGSDYSRQLEIAELTENLKALALELRVPILVAFRLAAGNGKAGSTKRDILRSNEPGTIEKHADLILWIERPKNDPETRHEAQVTIGNLHNRDLVTVPLTWHDRFTSFKDSPLESRS
jgi:replicative DNA helicase